MENLIFSLNVTVPIFILMILGYLFRKMEVFDDAFLIKVNKFVFKITLPALLFKDLAETDFIAAWDGEFVLFCFGVTVVSIGISFGLSFLIRKNADQAEFIQASYRSSAAILGIAFIQNIYGNSGMAPLMIVASVPLYNVCAVLVLSVFGPEKKKISKEIFFKTLSGIAKNPIIIGILVGFLWSLFSLPKPLILMKTMNNLAVLATPLGLMAMGGSFSFEQGRKQLKAGCLCAFMKLIGFAAIFLPIAIRLGYRDDKLIAILVMLGSATTVTCYIMAKNMGHEGSLSACVVGLTTLFSAFTLTFWLFLLRTMGLI